MHAAPLELESTRPNPDPEFEFYRDVLQSLNAAGVEALVGGAYAFAVYTGIERPTKDLDLFVRRTDFGRVADVLQDAGYETELTFPHWLGKAYGRPWFVDLIFDSGNGTTPVDDGWFVNAPAADVLGVPARIVPPEEMIWSKAFVMERERYDGADVAHMIRACADTLDWHHLLQRFGRQWRVLLSHLVLFGFVYPGERARVPAWLMEQLLQRLQAELRMPGTVGRVCKGTLISREQYLHDVHALGYIDGRLLPDSTMSADDVVSWTEAIAESKAESKD